MNRSGAVGRWFRKSVSPTTSGALGGAIAALAVLMPWWRPGALLVRDLVAVPDPAWSPALLEASGRLPRDIPGEMLAAAAGQVVPGDLFVRAAILAALVYLAAGVGRLVRATPPLAAAVGGFVAVWNPYVLGRLHQGQWLVLVALGAVPWIVVHLRADDRWRLARTVVVASLSGFLTFVVAIPTLLIVGTVARRFRAVGVGTAVAIVMALPWLLIADGLGSDPDGFRAFAPNADLAGGVVPSLLTGGGYFNAAVASPWRERWLVAAVALFLLALAVVGLGMWIRAARGRDRHIRSGFVLAGLSALLVAMVAASGAGQEWLGEASEALPGLSVLRDSHRLLAPWVIALAVGTAMFAGSGGVRSQTVPGVAAVVVVAAIVALPDPIIGPRLPEPSTLPPAWQEAADLVNGHQAGGAVLVAPFGQTQRYDFTDHRAVAVPLRRLMRPPVLVDSRLAVGDLVVDERVADEPFRRLASRPVSNLSGSELASHGVSWVAVTDPRRFVSMTGPDTKLVLDAPSIQLIRVELPGGAALGTTRPASWLITVDVLVGLVALGAVVAPMMGRPRASPVSGRGS
ncbi:MAG: hypothetical protein R3320_01435 [Nitriliruptorales bacterium]|nr:hypothetical protein [Nitriliruptorales bacterium]